MYRAPPSSLCSSAFFFLVLRPSVGPLLSSPLSSPLVSCEAILRPLAPSAPPAISAQIIFVCSGNIGRRRGEGEAGQRQQQRRSSLFSAGGKKGEERGKKETPRRRQRPGRRRPPPSPSAVTAAPRSSRTPRRAHRARAQAVSIFAAPGSTPPRSSRAEAVSRPRLRAPPWVLWASWIVLRASSPPDPSCAGMLLARPHCVSVRACVCLPLLGTARALRRWPQVPPAHWAPGPSRVLLLWPPQRGCRGHRWGRSLKRSQRFLNRVLVKLGPPCLYPGVEALP